MATVQIMDALSLRESATDAIAYWEHRRLAYNLALAAVVIACFVFTLPVSKTTLSVDTLLTLFLLAVLANVAYCAAYVADTFAQASAFRDKWRNYRWILFAVGISFAGVLARFLALALFRPTSH
jgi:hypothetical protein